MTALLLFLMLHTGTWDLVPLPRSALELLQGEEAARLREERDRLDAVIRNPDKGIDELAEGFGNLGRLYLLHNQLEVAEASFLIAQEHAPEEFSWSYYLGVLAQFGRRPQEAIAELNRALELRPDDLPTLLRIGETQLLENNLDGAEETYTAALGKNPGSAAALAGLGRVAFRRGEYAEAAEQLGAALELQPRASSLHHELGLAYRQMGERELAETHLRQSGSAKVRFADPLMDKLLKWNPSAGLYLDRGNVALREGRLPAALAAYQRAAALDPDDMVVQRALATTLTQMGRKAQAADVYVEILRREPEDARAHYNLGVLKAGLGDTDAAIEHLRTSVRIAPEMKNAHFNLATGLATKGELEEAVKHLRTVLELDPGDEEAQQQLVAALFELGSQLGKARQYSASADRFEELLEIRPDLETAHLARGMGLVMAERYAEARVALEESLRALPQSATLAHALARLMAACPEQGIRNGGLALELASSLFQVRQSPEHAETLAMALAEVGRFDEAVALQSQLVAEAEKAGREDLLPVLRHNLALYETGEPCRSLFGIR